LTGRPSLKEALRNQTFHRMIFPERGNGGRHEKTYRVPGRLLRNSKGTDALPPCRFREGEKRRETMSIFLIKSIMASFFLGLSLSAFFSMMTLMGKSEKKLGAVTLRRIHKTSGFLYFALLLIISAACIRYWIRAGDQISARALMHSVLALGLIVIFLIKVAIVQFYKQFLRMAPVLGMIVLSFTFVVFGTSGGYYLLRALAVSSAETVMEEPTKPGEGSSRRDGGSPGIPQGTIGGGVILGPEAASAANPLKGEHLIAFILTVWGRVRRKPSDHHLRSSGLGKALGFGKMI